MNRLEIAAAIQELHKRPENQDKKLTEIMHEILMEVRFIEAKEEEKKL